MKKIIALMALCLYSGQAMEGPKNNPYALCKTGQDIQKKYDEKSRDLAEQCYLELFDESTQNANLQKPQNFRDTVSLLYRCHNESPFKYWKDIDKKAKEAAEQSLVSIIQRVPREIDPKNPQNFRNTVSELYRLRDEYPFKFSKDISKKAEEAAEQALESYIERAASAYASEKSEMYQKEMNQILEKFPFNYIGQETIQKISQKIKDNALAIKNGTFKAVVLKQESSLESVSRAKELEEYEKQGYRIERRTIEIIEGGKAKKAQETIVTDKKGKVVAKYSDIFEN